MKIDDLCVNNLRTLSMDMINNANSGHPGIALGISPILYSLYTNIMHVTPKQPKHIFRDRFVLSAGHGSSILYATLHACGFNFSLDDLKNFRKLDAKCTGHPEYEIDNGIDASTGPLGQGIANAVGMAISEEYMASIFNKPNFKLIDNYTYVLCGDGCLMEGVANEALSLAGTLKLKKLIVLYDSNNITLDGKTDVSFKQNTKKVMQGYGFNVLEVKDGNSVKEITKTIRKAKTSNKPSFIIVNTKIGYGSNFEGDCSVHGKPLGSEETKILKQNLKINVKEFEILPEVQKHFSEVKQKYDLIADVWEQKLNAYKEFYETEYQYLMEFLNQDYSNIFNFLKILQNKDISTRDGGGEILNKIACKYDNIIGGCADVSKSTKAILNEEKMFSSKKVGRNIAFGIREFAMSSIANGIALYGGLVPFVSTFFAFGDYLKAGVRMSALQNLKVLYILTHDSLFVGEDGPTHQPIEQLAMFRSIPNTYVFRPCDFVETACCYALAMNINAPSVIVETRQKLNMQNTKFNNIKYGAYIVKKETKEKLDVVLIATGSEVELSIAVANMLENNNISTRVVSMPCMELFEEQSDSYKQKILPKDVFTCAIELSSDKSFYKYIGNNGTLFGINQFGISGKGEEVAKKYGFSAEQIYNKILKLLK